MSDGTKIEWTDATVNAVNGCSVVSPGCTNCYAMRLAGTRMKTHPTRAGLTIDTKAGPVWTGEVRLNEKALVEPLRWRRPRTIFWNAHGDLFHPSVPDSWIDRQFATMAVTTQHIHQVLTKRPDRMRAYFTSLPNRDDYIREAARANGCTLMTCRDAAVAARSGMENLRHIWLGVSVEDQKRADERIPDLLATPATVRFLSCEPLLGPVDLTELPSSYDGEDRPLLRLDALRGDHHCGPARFDDDDIGRLHWIICGGESGPNARPMHPDWARSLRDQCAAAGVPFFFKQWGAWTVDDEPLPRLPDPALALRRGRISMYPDGAHMGRGFFPEGARNLIHLRRVSKAVAGRLLDGIEHNGMPGGAA